MNSKVPTNGTKISETEFDRFVEVESRLATVLAILYEMEEVTAYPGQSLRDAVRYTQEATRSLWLMHECCEQVLEQLDRERDQKA